MEGICRAAPWSGLRRFGFGHRRQSLSSDPSRLICLPKPKETKRWNGRERLKAEPAAQRALEAHARRLGLSRLPAVRRYPCRGAPAAQMVTHADAERRFVFRDGARGATAGITMQTEYFPPVSDLPLESEEKESEVESPSKKKAHRRRWRKRRSGRCRC